MSAADGIPPPPLPIDTDVGNYMVSILSIERNTELYTQIYRMYVHLVVLYKVTHDKIQSLCDYRREQIGYRRRLLRNLGSTKFNVPLFGLTPGIFTKYSANRNDDVVWGGHGVLNEDLLPLIMDFKSQDWYRACKSIIYLERCILQKRQSIKELEAAITTDDQINQLLIVDFAHAILNNLPSNKTSNVTRQEGRGRVGNSKKNGTVRLRLSECETPNNSVVSTLELQRLLDASKEIWNEDFDDDSPRVTPSGRYRLIYHCHKQLKQLNWENLQCFNHLVRQLSDHQEFRGKINECLEGIPMAFKRWDDTRSDLSAVGTASFPEEDVKAFLVSMHLNAYDHYNYKSSDRDFTWFPPALKNRLPLESENKSEGENFVLKSYRELHDLIDKPGKLDRYGRKSLTQEVSTILLAAKTSILKSCRLNPKPSIITLEGYEEVIPMMLEEMQLLKDTNNVMLDKLIFQCQSEVYVFDLDFNNLIIDFVNCVLAQQGRE